MATAKVVLTSRICVEVDLEATDMESLKEAIYGNLRIWEDDFIDSVEIASLTDVVFDKEAEDE